ncbi:nuclear transport factor 2 family protein [Modestobacter sp. NPDC049651]|uniref:nuclear transport factor 2 family protein n=1 Tax=unclassified Modestobacter TaxID=2643866 RepID=UPI0033F4ADFD
MTGRTRVIDELARDVARVESLREVKDLQRTWAQLSQLGEWTAMADLFAADGTMRWGDEVVQGRAAIAAWLTRRAGAMDGRTPGSLHTEVVDQPLANLSADGRTARARWQQMAFLGDGAGQARIEAGLQEDEYVLEDGRWRIALLRHVRQYEGDYATGWTNVDGAGLPIVPPHFTVDETGVPVPPPAGPASRTGASAADLARRIDRLEAEDAVRNLQHACGYYVDRKMWTDVVDLFTDDGVVRIDGVGECTGRDGVRAALERMGAEGLRHGELNDRPLFDLVVQVQPDGRSARTRGIEVGMLADVDHGAAGWEFSVLSSSAVRDGDVWKLRELRLTPLLRADYDKGWASGGTWAQGADAAPPVLDVAGRTPPVAAGTDAADPDVTDLARRLSRARAFDGVENVSAAYGFYIDDLQWPQMAGIIAEHGNKSSPFAGYYLGRQRILGAALAFYRRALPPDALRSRISFHWRTQPVVHVSHDGRSATLRTRLFQPRTQDVVTPGFTGFFSGMYPNDQAVLEDGVWRLWSVTIDEPYFESPTWAGGWGSAVDRPAGAPNPPGSRLLEVFPPDVPLTDLGEREEGFRGGTGTTVEWPGIVPMWFAYVNPVSGRVPERYWPDCVTAQLRPETSLTAHGYELPPTGPPAVTP